MALKSLMARKFHSVFPTNLVNISPFPGRLVCRRGRFANMNVAVEKDGKVNPDYEKSDKNFFPITQGAGFWRKDYDLAMRIYCFEQESGWILMEEDPTMIWEVAEGTQVPRDLRLVEYLEAPPGKHKFTLQPSTSMPFTALSFYLRQFQLSSRNHAGSVVKRLQDWKASKIPFFDEYPELLRGRWPDPLKDPDITQEERLEILSDDIADTASWIASLNLDDNPR